MSSFSKWWKDTTSILHLNNLIDGPPRPSPSPELSPLSEETPPPPTLRDYILRIHRETTSSMAEDNAEFLITHHAAFEILARANWEANDAWNYIQRLAGDGRRYSGRAIEQLARNVVPGEEAEIEWETVENLDIDAPEGWREVVLKWVHYGFDVDYVQSFAYLLSDIGGARPVFGPEDLSRGFRELVVLEEGMWDLVPGLRDLWGRVSEERHAEEDEGEDEEMGDYDAQDYEPEDESTGCDDDEDEEMIDDALIPEDGETTDDDIREPSPTSGRFEVIETPAGGRRFVPVTDAERDVMIQDGEYEESFNQNGTSYMYHTTHDEESSLPDYVSSPIRPATPASRDPSIAGLPEGTLTQSPGGTLAPGPAYRSIRERFPEMFDTADDHDNDDPDSLYSDVDSEVLRREEIDQYYEDALADLEDRFTIVEGGSDSSDGYRTSPGKVTDDAVRADRPSTTPPGDVLIEDDEPSDDGDTGEDSDDQDPLESQYDDTTERYDIHDRLIWGHQGRNNAFVETHRSVFSILAAEGGWTPYMAWRFVRFLAWSQGGTITITEMINTVVKINEDQLHQEYTRAEEILLLADFTPFSELRQIMRTLYRAGFAPEYLQGYLRELESDGRSSQEIENELEGYEVGDWIFEWVPSLAVIWNDAGAMNDTPMPSPPSVTPVHNRHSPRPMNARFSPGPSQYISNTERSLRTSPRTPSGRQPYSPTHPPTLDSAPYLTSSEGPPGPNPSPSSVRRTSPFGSTASANIQSPTASELFFRGQNPDHVGAASPQSPRFLAESSPTMARSHSLPTIPPRRSSGNTPTVSQLAGWGNVPQGSTTSLAGLSSPPYAPLSPVPRTSPELPTSSKLAALRYAVQRPSGPTSNDLARSFPRTPSSLSGSIPQLPPPQPPVDSARGFPGRTSSSRYALSNRRSPTYPRPESSNPAFINQFTGLSPTPRPPGNQRRRPKGIPLVDPLRYANFLTPPRRLATTPTTSHQPPSPRRSGPRPRVCGECGRSYAAPPSPERRTVGGRIIKSSSSPPPAVMRKSPASRAAIRKSPSPPVPIAKQPSRRAIKKTAVTKGATNVVKKAAVKKAVTKQAVTKVALLKQAAVTPRRSGRATRRPDFLGS